MPANVLNPGDGSYVRQWWYNQQDAENQALINAGGLQYPTNLLPDGFEDTFALGDNTNINLQRDGKAYFKNIVSGGGTSAVPQWQISPNGNASGITITRAAVTTDEKTGTVETLIDIINDLRARVAQLEEASGGNPG